MSLGEFSWLKNKTQIGIVVDQSRCCQQGHLKQNEMSAIVDNLASPGGWLFFVGISVMLLEGPVGRCSCPSKFNNLFLIHDERAKVEHHPCHTWIRGDPAETPEIPAV
jgi:hypothetical protein